MINKINGLRAAVLLLLCWLLPQLAMASCNFAPTSPVQQGMTFSVPLEMSKITVGADYPPGSVVYRQEYKPAFGASQNLRITCDSPGAFYINKSLASTPLPLTTWNGSPYAGHVYETGIPGLGAVITYGGYSYANGTTYPSQVQACVGGGSSQNSCDVPNGHFGFVLTIIATGKSVPPGVIKGASLPCPKVTMGTSGNEVSVVNACFTGTIQVVAKTCQTPDVFVDLGSHSVNEFKGKGSATKWVDASLKMKDCPVFYGYNRFGGSWSENGSYQYDRATPNQVWYSFTPAQGVIDAANSIINIDKSVDGSADGIGIQIASGTGSNPVPVNFADGNRLDLPTDGSTDISIPLVARYVQTASSAKDLKPGVANGRMTFLINYY
ncbi:type 1 fimbrial protein [Enterobacteriaceae bacterium 89]|nr:type 1 fimbrial protein [Enterobacteriaceae bacterium 89]